MLRDGRRRLPVPRDRYRSVARNAGLGPRFRRTLGALDALTLFLALAFLLVVTPMLGGVLSTGVADVGAQVAALFPAGAGTGTIDVRAGGGGTVTTAPVADGLPDYTRDPQLKLTGRVPSFVSADGRAVRITLNGTAAATVTPGPAGVFQTALTLREGANTIELALVSRAAVGATSTYHVVLDRQPPPLTLTKPANADTIEATTLTIQGKTEAGASVTVNERTVIVAQDGSFSGTISVAPGSLPITVVARDRAGNETKTKLTVTVKAPATAATASVLVVLDQTRVRPGATVTAHVLVTGNAISNVLVTVSVGTVTVGSVRTDAGGIAAVAFAAPAAEGDVAVVALTAGGSGRATLTVAR